MTSEVKDLYGAFIDDRLRIGRVFKDFLTYLSHLWSSFYSNTDTLEEIATRDEHQNEHNDFLRFYLLVRKRESTSRQSSPERQREKWVPH